MKNLDVYLLILVPVACILVFNILPMFGVIIAFKDFKIFKGILDSDWAGLAHFKRMFSQPKFGSIFFNTVIINVLKFIFQFPLPILFALLLNELAQKHLKRPLQTMLYLPHFLSWVIVAGIFYDLLSTRTGIINRILPLLGVEPINFLSESEWFRPLMVVTTAWKESGWNTIVYLSAITAIDPELYQAAAVDGAGRWKQTLHVTLPGIVVTIAFIIILRASAILGSDLEQVLMFYSPVVYDVGDVIGTYVYREGIMNQSYSYTTAVGLFSSLIASVMMIFSNRMVRRYAGRGIF